MFLDFQTKGHENNARAQDKQPPFKICSSRRSGCDRTHDHASIRRIAMAGSLAISLSGALLWSAISPVSASDPVHLTSGVASTLAGAVSKEHSLSRSAPHTENVAHVTARVTDSATAKQVNVTTAARKSAVTPKVVKPVTRRHPRFRLRGS